MPTDTCVRTASPTPRAIHSDAAVATFPDEPTAAATLDTIPLSRKESPACSPQAPADTPEVESPAPRPVSRLDPLLVAAAMDGDPRSVDALLAALRPLVTNYCRARLGVWSRRTGDADDCAQEVMLAVFSVLPRYQGSPEAFLPFVYGIAAHKVHDLFRRESRDRSRPLADFEAMDSLLAERGPGPAEWAELDDTLRDMRQSMEVLTSVQRDVLVLRVLLGFSAAETAEALGIPSAGAVRVVQHRALARLRAALGTERVVARSA